MTRFSPIIAPVMCALLMFAVATAVCEASPKQVLRGEAIGKVLLAGEPWGTGKVTFTNAPGDVSLVVTCDKDVSAGANSATCIGTDVDGFFSGGRNGVATFGSGSALITLQMVDGKKFTYAQGGVSGEFIVSDPSIFDNWDMVDEDEDPYEPEEYDPEAPLTDSRARASHIDGQVEIACPPDFEAWDVLKPGRVIYNHCRLKTGEESTLKISFGDMTTFVMRPETQVVINSATKEKSNIRLLFGGIWANVKKMARGEEFGFKGSQAVAGIKGTVLVMEDTGVATTLKVIEGAVEFTDKAGARAETVGTGEAMTADAKGLGAKTEFDVQNELKNWDMPAAAPEVASAPEPAADRMVRENLPAQVDSGKGNLLWWAIGAFVLVSILGAGAIMMKRPHR